MSMKNDSLKRITSLGLVLSLSGQHNNWFVYADFIVYSKGLDNNEMTFSETNLCSQSDKLNTAMHSTTHMISYFD